MNLVFKNIICSFFVVMLTITVNFSLVNAREESHDDDVAILEAYVRVGDTRFNGNPNTVNIIGKNFNPVERRGRRRKRGEKSDEENDTYPIIGFGNMGNLEVLQVSDKGTEIVAKCPSGLCPDGDFLLSVTTNKDNDVFDLTITINSQTTFNTALVEEQTARIDALNNETYERQTGDSDLQQKITVEESARINADSTLETQLSAEENARISSDQTEASLRTNQDTAEINARISADQNLQDQIDDMKFCSGDFSTQIDFGTPNNGVYPNQLCISDRKSTPPRVNVVQLITDTVVNPWCVMFAKGAIPAANFVSPYFEYMFNYGLNEMTSYVNSQIKSVLSEYDLTLNTLDDKLRSIDDSIERPINDVLGTKDSRSITHHFNYQFGVSNKIYKSIIDETNKSIANIQIQLNGFNGKLVTLIKSLDDPIYDPITGEDIMPNFIDEGAVENMFTGFSIPVPLFTGAKNDAFWQGPLLVDIPEITIGRSNIADSLNLQWTNTEIPQIDTTSPVKQACLSNAENTVDMMLMGAGITAVFIEDMLGLNNGHASTFDEAMTIARNAEVADFYDAQLSCANIGGHICTRREVMLSNLSGVNGLFVKGDWSGGEDPKVLSSPSSGKNVPWPPVEPNLSSFPPIKMSMPQPPSGEFRCCSANLH